MLTDRMTEAVVSKNAGPAVGMCEAGADAEYVAVCLTDVPYQLDRLFDYSVPPELRGTVTRGDFVRVPFGAGNRPKLALVISLSAKKPELDEKRIKSVAEILPREMSLNEEQVSLCEYMREHILCSYGDAVKTVIPPFILGKPKIVYRLVSEPAQDVLSDSDPELRKRVLDAIGKKGTGEEKLRKTLSKLELRELAVLGRSGVVSAEISVSRPDGKYEECVTLRISPEEAGEIAVSLETKAPAMSAALRELAACGEMSPSELREAAGIDRAVLRRLEQRGYACITKCEINRGYLRDAQTLGCDAMSGGAPVGDDRPLSPAQSEAMEKLCEVYESGKASAALLYGVTGSGKTRVIKAMIDRTLRDGRSVIVLIPEIALTPQTVGYFCSCYGKSVAVIHSMLSQGERLDAWKSMKRGEARICIGTRSAVFAPLENIGLIVIDEEQEHTYKSDISPKYHARDIARFRCAKSSAMMLLASATPSLESYYRAKSGLYRLVEMKERFSGTPLPETIISDISGLQKNGGGLIGDELDSEIRSALAEHRQIILFMNRRGYNHFVRCPACGETLRCPNCSLALTFHSVRGDASGELRCHMCGHRERIPEKCPSCGGEHLVRVGFGIQRVEEELSSRYPGAVITRMDADTTSSKLSFYRMINSFREGGSDILIGTQMVTKGHDFPGVDVSGVILADTSLYLDDYRANERTFSMLTQLIGRSGRAGKRGRAVIQTYSPDNAVIKYAAAQDYKAFYESEIRLRKALLFPPFCRIALISVSSENESRTAQVCTALYKRLTGLLESEYKDVKMVCFGPYEAQVYRVNKRFRYRIVCKLRSDLRTRELLRKVMNEFTGADYSDCSVGTDIDPANL